MENMGYRALDIAREIVAVSAEYGDLITNLKLQKLLYYTNAWYMALHKKSLFEEDFQAWIHGPVVPSVYRYFKDCMSRPIIAEKRSASLDPEVSSHILDILSEFGGYSVLQLEIMTHREDPWRDARGTLPPDQSSTNTISKSSIYKYYSGLANVQEA